MKNGYLACLAFISIASFSQEVIVTDHKGTFITVDNSKWGLFGTSIFNKNTGNVGIGTSVPNNFLEIKGSPNSSKSGLRLTGLGAVTPSTPLSNVLSVNADGDVVVTTSPAIAPIVGEGNWFLSGNSIVNNNSFLGTTNDTKMNIGTNGETILELGRRGTLGLVDRVAPYKEVNQNMVHIKGNGTSALQFESASMTTRKPVFYTTTDGNFTLKSNAAGTDVFAIGSEGTNGNGLLEIAVGEDGNEPIAFRKYNKGVSGLPQTYIEMMRMQGIGLTTDVRIGIRTNNTVPNSTLQVGGSMSLPIARSNPSMILDETHFTVLIIGNHYIGFPSAKDCTGRIYIIKNLETQYRNTGRYIDANGNVASTIPENSTLIIQSDGTNWQSLIKYKG